MMKKNSVISQRVVYIVEDAKSAQFGYRVANVIKALGKNNKWKAEYCLKDNISEINFSTIDILVILRQTSKDNVALNLIKQAHKHKIKVLFDLDDLVFDYNDLFLVSNTVCEKSLLYWLGYFWGIRRIAKKVDGFLCTNDFLGEKLKRSFGKPYKVIKNSLNQDQIRVSEKYIKNKIHDGFKIGYFSGSSTHAKDFRLIEPEIIKFLENNSDARLRIVGYMKFSKEMQKMIGVKKVEVLKPVDHSKLQELIAEVDVNIAPLVINDFTNCKSELKFFEAAAVETTTIASPTYTFRHVITDGKNGFLAQPGEWYDKLEYLYKHTENNRKIAKEAKKYALEHYYGKEFLEEVEEAYDFFAK